MIEVVPTNRILVLALALVALLSNVGLTIRNIQKMSQADTQAANVQHRLLDLEILFSTLKDAESGQRGYLLTGEKAYLAPYEASIGRVGGLVSKVSESHGDSPALGKLKLELTQSVKKRLDDLSVTLDVRRVQGPEAALGFVLSGEGRRLMGEIRQEIAAINLVERLELERCAAESERSRRVALTTTFLGALVGLALLSAAYVLIAREIVSRQRVAEVLEGERDLLEDRVAARTAELVAANESLRREVDERLRAERAAHEAATELARSNKDLEQFAYVASHDLQEPLRKIQTFGDLLKSRHREGLGVEGADLLDRVLSAAGRMRALIEGLLEYSRVSSHETSWSEVRLADIVSDVIGDLEGRLRASGGTIDVGPLPSIEADAVQMRQLFQNLLGNALKFRKPGVPPTVLVRTEAAGEDEDEVTVTISDDGVGFEAEFAERAFELFQRLHGRAEFEGTGMGLAIVKRIVERHGGRVSATSQTGHGSTFRVTMPKRHEIADVER